MSHAHVSLNTHRDCNPEKVNSALGLFSLRDEHFKYSS